MSGKSVSGRFIIGRLMSSSDRNLAAKRRGAGFIFLVMMVLLVIISATQWLVSASVANQRGDLMRLRAHSMLAAIEQSRLLETNGQAPLRFPINDAIDEKIIVTQNDGGSTVTAVWLRGEVTLAEMTRPIASHD